MPAWTLKRPSTGLRHAHTHMPHHQTPRQQAQRCGSHNTSVPAHVGGGCGGRWRWKIFAHVFFGSSMSTYSAMILPAYSVAVFSSALIHCFDSGLLCSQVWRHYFRRHATGVAKGAVEGTEGCSARARGLCSAGAASSQGPAASGQHSEAAPKSRRRQFAT